VDRRNLIKCMRGVSGNSFDESLKLCFTASHNRFASRRFPNDKYLQQIVVRHWYPA
jgi:hypothetical protein